MRTIQRAAFGEPGQSGDAESEVGPFVLNLCSVPGPIALPQPRSRDLTRFTFFCSRGSEGERQQCWLHMGYFSTRTEAQKWLGVLHRVYPKAFVSQAQLTVLAEHSAMHEYGAARRRE